MSFLIKLIYPFLVIKETIKIFFQTLRFRKKLNKTTQVLDSVMIQTSHNKITLICNNEKQVDSVNKIFSKKNSKTFLTNYEEWDGDKDKKFILTYEIMNEQKPMIN